MNKITHAVWRANPRTWRAPDEWTEAALNGRDGGSGPGDGEAMALTRAARLAPRALDQSGRLSGVRHVVHCLARVRNPSVFVVPHPSTVSGLKSSLF